MGKSTFSAHHKSTTDSRQQDLRCSLCGARGEFFACEAGFTLVRCRPCGVISVWPQPNRAELAALYSARIRCGESYWREYLRNEEAHRSHARYLLKLLPVRPPGRLLEVGSGPGFFLHEARKLSWEVYGVDLAEPFVTWGRQNLGLDLRLGQLSDHRFPEGSFRVVVLCDVLSHLPDPSGTMTQIASLLEKGGVLFLQAGNKAERTRKDPHDDWQTPLHLFHFTREGIVKLLAKAGLRVEQIIVAPRLSAPASARRTIGRLPFARPIYRALRRTYGLLCPRRSAPDSTLYITARKL